MAKEDELRKEMHESAKEERGKDGREGTRI